MKKVEFSLSFEVHKGLDEEDLEVLLKDYLINDYIVENFVSSVISEEESIENFAIGSVDLVLKKQIKKTSKKNNKRPDLVGEQWKQV
jgi:hypothetical protein|tara:strand:- start:24 stop:284 length:261 start_codon:yes stop_codon:yes gene_type:complete